MNKSLKDDIRYKNHETRPDLAGEHLLGDTYQIIAFGVFVAANMADFFLIGLMWGFQAIFHLWLRLPFSITLFCLGAWLSLYGIHIVFSEYSETPIFRREGMFSVIRHPIYLGAILIYLAALLLTLSPLAATVWIAIIWLYHWLAEYEEGRMLEVFGDSYRGYQRHVPMWLPTLIKRDR